MLVCVCFDPLIIVDWFQKPITDGAEWRIREESRSREDEGKEEVDRKNPSPIFPRDSPPPRQEDSWVIRERFPRTNIQSWHPRSTATRGKGKDEYERDDYVSLRA